MAASPDFGVRSLAIAACSKVGIGIDMTPTVAAALPGIYDLSLPPLPDDRRRDLPAGTSLPDSDNPAELASAWMGWCEPVAAIAGVEADSLLRRVFELMSAVDSADGWTRRAEEELKAQLDAADLEHPYRRPRAAISRRAVLRVIAELLDSGRIPKSRTADDLRVIRVFDPLMLLLEPEPRPAYVTRVQDYESYSRGDPTWIDNVDNAISLGLREIGEWKVLAEETEVCRLDWGRPTEARLSVVHDSRDEVDPTEFFPLVYDRLMEEYLSVDWGTAGAGGALITKHFAHGYDSPGADWLAINPGIARGLGWQPSDEGLFRWVDASGQVMVESRWWIEGMKYFQLHADEEVGEGWLVVASAQGWEHLHGFFEANLVRTVEGRRRYSDEEGSEKEERKALKELA